MNARIWARGRLGTWSAVALAIAPLAVTGCAGEGMTAGGDPDDVRTAEQALGKTWQVGPTRTYKNLQAVASQLQAGDVVEIDGNATYSGGVLLSKSGTAASKITIRGVKVNGKRPVLSGGTSTLEIAGNHNVIEGLDITGGTTRCVFHRAHGITIRDTVVHGCAKHGILGADEGSGSLTLEYSEVYDAGGGTTNHPIYMATDESTYPGAVFRMQHCYVHDANGGNAVKTRAERNEIYYNWIEGGLYKDLELIGPDGQDPSLAREDSDVVGNVFRKTHTQYVVRVGGDGTGDTNGRYRFINNTFLLMQGSNAAIHAFEGIESIEMTNNVFHRVGGGSVQIMKDEGIWAKGKQLVSGRNNMVPTGTSVPATWVGTLITNNPGFVDVANRNVKLAANSPLINAGSATTASPVGYPFPSPLATALFHPPAGKLEALGTAAARPVVGTVDIGAFEYGVAAVPPPPPPTEPTEPTPAPGTCATGTPAVWSNNAMTAKTGTFTAEWDVTPSAALLDGALALSQGPQSTWDGLAAIIRFNPLGYIDVRNGDLYQSAATVTYAAGATYHVRAVVNVSTKTYSVYVTAPGKAETLIASNYKFRTAQQSVGSLSSWTVNQLTAGASLKACGFVVK